MKVVKSDCGKHVISLEDIKIVDATENGLIFEMKNGDVFEVNLILHDK